MLESCKLRVVQPLLFKSCSLIQRKVKFYHDSFHLNFARQWLNWHVFHESRWQQYKQCKWLADAEGFAILKVNLLQMLQIKKWKSLLDLFSVFYETVLIYNTFEPSVSGLTLLTTNPRYRKESKTTFTTLFKSFPKTHRYTIKNWINVYTIICGVH